MKLFNRKDSAKNSRPFCSAVVPAAGSSARMAGVNKMLLELNGIPVLMRTLMALECCDGIDEIIVVTRDADIPEIAALCKGYNIEKVTKIVCGGKTRPESVSNGLREVSENAELVAVHDGARPFVTNELICGVIDAAAEFKAAAPGVKVKDTIKIVKDGVVDSTPDRELLYAIQTPQIFDVSILREALASAAEKGLAITDDCMAVEAMGVSVHIVDGSYDNIKITTPEDVYKGEAIIEGGLK